MKKYLITISSIVLLFIVFIGYKLLSTNQENTVPTIKAVNLQRNFNISEFLKNSNDVVKDFPYDKYIASSDYQTYSFLRNDIDQLSNKLKDNGAAQSLIYNALTDSLLKAKPALIGSEIDSLIVAFQWADKFRIYAEADSINSNLYLAVNEYWMSKLTDRLVSISNETPNMVNNFKFKFLLTKCNEVKYNASIKNNSISKFIQNLLKSNWSHLFLQTWNQASKLQLIFLFLIVTITIISYTVLLKSIIKSIKK
jgi:hypothetical protein